MDKVAHYKGIVPDYENMFDLLEQIPEDMYTYAESEYDDDEYMYKLIEQKTKLYGYYEYYEEWLKRYFKKVCNIDTDINFCILNKYNTKHAIGWHDDYGISSAVTLSFGATRKLKFRNKHTEKEVGEFTLDAGDLFIFHSSIDNDHEHCVPPDINVKGNRYCMLFDITSNSIDVLKS